MVLNPKPCGWVDRMPTSYQHSCTCSYNMCLYITHTHTHTTGVFPFLSIKSIHKAFVEYTWRRWQAMGMNSAPCRFGEMPTSYHHSHAFSYYMYMHITPLPPKKYTKQDSIPDGKIFISRSS